MITTPSSSIWIAFLSKEISHAPLQTTKCCEVASAANAVPTPLMERETRRGSDKRERHLVRFRRSESAGNGCRYETHPGPGVCAPLKQGSSSPSSTQCPSQESNHPQRRFSRSPRRPQIVRFVGSGGGANVAWEDPAESSPGQCRVPSSSSTCIENRTLMIAPTAPRDTTTNVSCFRLTQRRHTGPRATET